MKNIFQTFNKIMFRKRYLYDVYLLFLICSIVDAHQPSLFDVRIDHHKVETARDLIINTPRPKFSWKIRVSNNKLDRHVQQIAYQIQLQTNRDQSFRFDTDRIVSSKSVHVPFVSKQDLLPSTYYQVRVRIWTTNSMNESSEWTNWIHFRTAIFNLHQYLTENTTAVWIGSKKINMNELRKEFTIPNTSPVKSAIVYITGLGYYELYINGYKVDPSRRLDPGWTSYEKRILVVSYDLTSNITVIETKNVFNKM